MSIKKYKRETLSSIEAKSLDSINQSVLIDMLLGNDKTSVEIAIILIAENIELSKNLVQNQNLLFPYCFCNLQ